MTFIGLLFILLFGALGAWRGALRFAAAFAALLLAGLVASPLHFLTGWMLSGVVPRVMLPLAGTVLTGLLLFGAMMLPMEIWLRRRERRRADDGLPPREPWQGYLGGVLGSAWGLCVLLLICLGIATIARVDRAMRTAQAELEFRAQRRQAEHRRAQQLARLNYTRAPEVNLKLELSPVSMRELKIPPPDNPRLEQLNAAVEHSLFAPMVERVSPVDVQREEVLKDLAVVVGDPFLMVRFQGHPKVEALRRDPRFQPLVTDPEIALAIHQGRFRELMDHEKICALAQDQELRVRLQELDIAAVLREVKGAAKSP